jgi:transcriptional regulator with XRE-family HTH domain
MYLTSEAKRAYCSGQVTYCSKRCMKNTGKVNSKKLKATAKERGYTANRVARESGVSGATVHFIFGGTVDPKASNLKRICDVLGLPIEEAFIQHKRRAA